MRTATATPAIRPVKAAQTPRQAAEALMTRYAALAKASSTILDDAKKEAAPKLKEMADIKAELQEWSTKFPSEFVGGKMLTVEAGTFGFKAGTKSVAFPENSPADIEDRYFKAVQKELPDAITEKVDSSAVVKAWAIVPRLRKVLEKLGMSIAQPDNFIITPKK